MWFELAFAGFFRQFGQLLADLFQAFLIHVFDDWNNQAVWRVGCETDIEVVFQHQVVAIQRGVEFREGFQRSNRGFNDERQWGQFHAFAFPFFVQLFAEFFQFGHVRFFVYGNVRNHNPVARQVLTGDFLNARQFFNFDAAEFREVNFRPWQQVQTTAQRGSGRFACTALHNGFNESFNVFAHDTAFQTSTFDLAQIYAQFARQFACGRTCMSFCECSFVDFGSSRRRGSRCRRSGWCSRSRSGSRCRCGSLSGRSRSCCGRAGSFYFDNGRAFGYFVANFQEYGFNHTGFGTWYVHGGFVGFQRNQGVVNGNSVADFNFNGNNVYVRVATDIRYNNLYSSATGRSGCRRSSWSSRSFCCRSRSGISSGSTGFNGQNHAAFRDFIANFNFNFFHDAGCISRYIHSGFIGFQCNQGVVNGDGVARFDFYSDDVDVFMTADIRDFDFYDTHLSSFNIFSLMPSENCFLRHRYSLFKPFKHSVFRRPDV